MDKVKKLLKMHAILRYICMAIILAIFIYNRYYYVSENFIYYVVLPFCVGIWVIMKVIQKKIRQESKLKVILTPKQYAKINETAQKQNKSVDQFCIEAINEKLEKSI